MVIGGELPQIFVNGESVRRNLEWRPRKMLQEGDRVACTWDKASISFGTSLDTFLS